MFNIYFWIFSFICSHICIIERKIKRTYLSFFFFVLFCMWKIMGHTRLARPIKDQIATIGLGTHFSSTHFCLKPDLTHVRNGSNLNLLNYSFSSCTNYCFKTHCISLNVFFLIFYNTCTMLFTKRRKCLLVRWIIAFIPTECSFRSYYHARKDPFSFKFSSSLHF